MMETQTERDKVISDQEKKLLENLGNIALFCPDVILSDARNRRSLDQLLCDDPRANEFIKLDCEIYIDQDDEDVKKFGDAIFDWVVSLCDLIRYINNDLNFTVTPSGSFPSKNKVENLNEFDYVLAGGNKGGVLEVEEFCGLGIFSFPQKDVVSFVLMEVLKLVLIESKKNTNLSDIRLIEMRHAINIQFSWVCSSNHKHSVSIDLAILIKTSITIQEYFRPVRCDLKGTPFEDLIDINEKMYWNCSFGGSGRADTNILNKQIFETCDRISPNIRLCYRVLKFIRDCFLPCFIVGRFCYLARNCVNFLKTCVSSYSLKQVLIREVIEFPSRDHWKNAFIHLRIASMLQKLLKHKLHLDDLFDERSKARLSCHVSDAFMSILTNMMRWLYDGCERISVTQRSMLCVCNEGITILLENKMLVSVPKRVLHTRVFSDLPIIANIIMFESFRPLVFQNKILGGLYEIFKGDVESMEHVDLTSFSDEGIVEIVFMLRFLIIGKKEIDSNNYSKKLKTFKEMLLKYDLPCSLLFDMFGNLESDYSIKSTDVSMYETMKEKMPSIFTSLETIFTCITWEERGYISRSLHEHCDRYTKEKISKTMKQLSDKVIDLFRNSPKEYTDCWKFRQTIWILVSINTVKKLK